MPPPAQLPGHFQPQGGRASLGPRLSGRCHRPQAEDAGPGPQGSRGAVGAPRAHTPPCSVPLDREGGLCFCGRHLDPVAKGSRVRDREVQPGSPMLGPRGARRSRWVSRCEELSAPGMRAGNGGAQLGDPVRGPPAAGVLTGLVLFPKDFWRISYKG